MPRISIVVPIYNVEQYLQACLDHVFIQEFTDYELILVNDGSTDGSMKIIQEYQGKYPSVKVINQQNRGAMTARKNGLSVATGEYVLFLDSDDYLSFGALERLNMVIEQFSPDIIKLNYCVFSEKSTKDEYAKYRDRFFKGRDMDTIRQELLYDENGSGLNMGIGSYSLWSTVSKRELAIKYHQLAPSTIRLGEDVAVTIPMIYNANSIFFMGGVYYNYRYNPSSTVNTFKADELQRIEVLINYLLSSLPTEKENAINVYALKIISLYTSFACKKLNKKEFLAWAEGKISDFLF